MGELRFHPASLRDGGTSVSGVGDRLAAEWRKLEATAKGMGDIFGDDDIGSLIGMTYQAAQQIAADSYGSAARGFTNFGGGLRAMADEFERSEHDSGKAVSDVGKAV